MGNTNDIILAGGNLERGLGTVEYDGTYVYITDANGTKSTTDFLAGDGGITQAAAMILDEGVLASAKTYADGYKSTNNTYTVQYNNGSDGFAGNSSFKFQNNTLSVPSVTLSGNTSLVMTDMNNGGQYYVYLSAGTFMFTGV